MYVEHRIDKEKPKISGYKYMANLEISMKNAMFIPILEPFWK